MPPIFPVSFRRAVKNSWKRDQGGAEPRGILTQLHCQLITFRWELGRATLAVHETGIKLEKQFYVLVVINSVRLAFCFVYQ